MYKFERSLEVGRIISRPNRFIMRVRKGRDEFICHCPSTGKIGNISPDNLPCLLSKSSDPKRKTAYTVEALAPDGEEYWVGINQNAVNRYVEYFFKNGRFDRITTDGPNILREQKVGNSKLDFKVGNMYIEVKMPLMYLPCAVTDAPLPKRNDTYFERFTRHVTDMGNILKNRENAAMLLCFMYDAPPFTVPKPRDNGQTLRVAEAVYKSVDAGVRMWQVNMSITVDGVNLLSYRDITEIFFEKNAKN
ncbi:MAG: DNA/RNA nuclease SfsA [Holosporaceae bacterium]|jgi:sugar fermentation stimulation protein A|nr:DNA/RNA nuclease SfsA [Holosporaceae bacterium]